MLRITTLFTSELAFTPVSNHPAGLEISVAYNINNEVALKVKKLKLEGIAVFVIDLKCTDTTFLSIETNESIWLMSFMLSGQAELRSVNEPAKTVIKENQYHTPILLNGDELSITATGSAKLFIVSLSAQNIRNLLAVKFEIDLYKVDKLNCRTTTMLMNDIISTITKYAENNTLHPILMTAKMLELLFLGMEQFKPTGKTDTSSIKSNDLEKLNLAKKLVAENLQNPYSLIELSRKVGLNDFKLKKGFKEAFGNTVFGHLLELRMEKAKNMLLSPTQSVSEVAHAVGYKNAHHFTVAFKKKFGYLPSKINRFSIWLLLGISLVA